MKDKYFGDRNDMFKYDLALTLIAEIDGLRAFTFIPMLTPDDGRADGNLTDYPALAKHRPRLHRFLMGCVAEPARRRVTSLRDYMREDEGDVLYQPYMDSEFLTDANRVTYFRGVASDALTKSVVLVDPDNGFEVGQKSMRRVGANKYLRYAELADLYHRMGEASVLVVYQHWAHIKRERAFSSVAERMKSVLPEALQPVCISSGSIGFFAITKTVELHTAVRDTIDKYATKTGFTVYPSKEEAALFNVEGKS